MDSIILKQALQSSFMDFATCGMLVRDTRDLLHEYFICTDILSVPRACNSVAHNLARVGMSWDSGEHHVWVNPFLEFVKDFVARDIVETMSLMRRPESQSLFRKKSPSPVLFQGHAEMG